MLSDVIFHTLKQRQRALLPLLPIDRQRRWELANMMTRRRRLSVLAVVGLALGLAACDTPEERVAAYIEDGKTFLAEGDVPRSSVSFRNALKIAANNAVALYHMGRIFELRENYPRAYAAYQSAAAADPAMVEAHNAYAVLALTAGELEPVRAAVEDIQAVDPENPDAFALSAALALRDDRIDEAEALAKRALASRPEHVNATSALAGSAHARGDTTSAVEIIDSYFANVGPEVSLALLKIQLLANAGDVGAVERAFRQLLEFAPDNAGFHLALADFYRGSGDVDAAEGVLRAVLDELETQPGAAVSLIRLVQQNQGLDAAIVEAEALAGRNAEADFAVAFVLADMLAAADRFDDAERRLNAVIDTAGADTQRGLDARAAIATVNYARGRPAIARDQLGDILAADGEHRGANYLSAVLSLDDGDLSEAIVSVRAALRREIDWVPGLKLLTRAHLANGEPDLALDSIRRAVQAAPNDVEAASILAQLLTQRGDYDAALRVWDVVMNLSPDDVGPRRSSAEIAIRQENWNRAAADIDRLLATPGEELSGTLLAGSLRLAQGDVEGARGWFERAQAMDPASPAPLMGMVRSFLVVDDVDGALALLDERSEREPGDALALNMRAQLLAQTGDVEAAILGYRATIAAEPRWSAPYRDLAMVLEREGRVDDAIDVLDEGVAAGADGAGELMLAKAFVQQRAERYDAAIATYTVLLDAGTDNDLVINNYAALVADFAYDDPALLARALELASRFNVSSEAYFLDTLGWLHYRAGDISRALPPLRRAAALLPDDPHIRYHVGATLKALEQPAAAIVELERAVVEGADYIGVDDAKRLLEELRELVPAAGADDNGSAS